MFLNIVKEYIPSNCDNGSIFLIKYSQESRKFGCYTKLESDDHEQTQIFLVHKEFNRSTIVKASSLPNILIKFMYWIQCCLDDGYTKLLVNNHQHLFMSCIFAVAKIVETIHIDSNIYWILESLASVNDMNQKSQNHPILDHKDNIFMSDHVTCTTSSTISNGKIDDIIICAGQSNMAGRVPWNNYNEYMQSVRDCPKFKSNPNDGRNIYTFCLFENENHVDIKNNAKDTTSKEYKWDFIPADQTHRDVDIQKNTGVGPVVAYANIDDTKNIGCIPTAVGSTCLADWSPKINLFSYHDDSSKKLNELSKLAHGDGEKYEQVRRHANEDGILYHADCPNLFTCMIRTISFAFQAMGKDAILDLSSINENKNIDDGGGISLWWYQGESDSGHPDLCEFHQKNFPMFHSTLLIVVKAILYFWGSSDEDKQEWNELKILSEMPLDPVVFSVTSTRVNLPHIRNIRDFQLSYNGYNDTIVVDTFGLPLAEDNIHLNARGVHTAGEAAYKALQRMRSHRGSRFVSKDDTFFTYRIDALEYMAAPYIRASSFLVRGTHLQIAESYYVAAKEMDTEMYDASRRYHASQNEPINLVSAGSGVSANAMGNVNPSSIRVKGPIKIKEKYGNYKMTNFVQGTICFRDFYCLLDVCTGVLPNSKINTIISSNKNVNKMTFVDLGSGVGAALAAASLHKRCVHQTMSSSDDSNVNNNSCINVSTFGKVIGFEVCHTGIESSRRILGYLNTLRYDHTNDNGTRIATNIIHGQYIPPCYESLTSNNQKYELWQDDFLKEGNLKGWVPHADIVYICATCYQDDITKSLKKALLGCRAGTRVILLDKNFLDPPAHSYTSGNNMSNNNTNYDSDSSNSLEHWLKLGSMQVRASWGVANAFIYERNTSDK